MHPPARGLREALHIPDHARIFVNEREFPDSTLACQLGYVCTHACVVVLSDMGNNNHAHRPVPSELLSPPRHVMMKLRIAWAHAGIYTYCHGRIRELYITGGG